MADPIDWTDLNENCAHDTDLINEVLELFVREAPALLNDVLVAVDAGDAVAIRRTAHRLKGALASLAATPAVAAAKALEHASANNKLDDVPVMRRTLTSEMDRLIEYLKARRIKLPLSS